MANRITIPFINPVRFYKQTPDTDDRFHSRLFVDWYFENTVFPWQQRVGWEQPWQKSDNLHLQVQTNVGPVQLKLYREDGVLVDTIAFSQIRQNYNDPEMFIYEVDVDMTGYPEGCYYFTMAFGSPVILILQSETICLKIEHENTVLIEYENRTFREDMIFETGIRPGIRVPGVLKYKGPSSKNTLYEDQVLDQQLIRAVNYRNWTLSIGSGKGIPDYMADTIDRILGCDTVIIDGKYYTKADNSLEPQEVEDYPLRGWSIDLRELNNRAAREFENDDPLERQVAAIVNVDSKGFGADTGGNETVISDIT